MTRWTPQKKDVLHALAREILHNYGKGRVLIAVDGVDGAGKTHFADDLAEAVRTKGHAAFRASIDGFHRPKSERYLKGKDSPEGFYRDSYDYSLFRRVLVEPFRLGGSTAFVPAAFDVARDTAVQPRWVTGPDDALLIVDGIFLHRPELRALWNYSIWLDVPPEIAEARLIDRDGPNGVGSRYLEGQKLYLAEANPRAAATAIYDNSDFTQPRRVFADAC